MRPCHFDDSRTYSHSSTYVLATKSNCKPQVLSDVNPVCSSGPRHMESLKVGAEFAGAHGTLLVTEIDARRHGVPVFLSC